ncbi:MAG TPA: class I SAM-dependent methyltransferase [Myxococcota bacterium]|jgi:SAM-dependent methyltransferase|nr:class I SAM-dependent methyltransferase [Myxococcota bacterium]
MSRAADDPSPGPAPSAPEGPADVCGEIDGGWRAQEALDAALARGEIDEEAWYRAVQARLVPAYLGGDNPRAQSGQSGDEAGWERARSLVVEAIDRDGTFLDLGCASGHLMETVQAWAAARGRAVEPYGLDLSPDLAALARRRLPAWAHRIWVGNALTWPPPRRFDFVHLMELSYVPAPRRPALVVRLLHDVCAPRGRLILGSFNEPTGSRATESLVASWGHPISGRAERPKSPRVMRRVFWLDAT